MQATAGVNYKPLRISYKRAQDALFELSMQHRKMLPNLSIQREWIQEALSRAFDCHASHPDFSMSKLELAWEMEDALYNTLEQKLVRGK
jgi:hypothetical protein